MFNQMHLDILNRGVEAWNVWRAKNPFTRPDLSGADLSNRDLQRIDLSGSLLIGTNLSNSNLHLANFGPACFEKKITIPYWRAARLESASLENSDLTQAYFVSVFHKTNMCGAMCRYTRFVDVHNIADAIGLDMVVHGGKCSIGIDTIFKGQGNIPDRFIRGCGYDPIVQKYVLNGGELEGHSIRLKTCFISYSSKDKEFSSKLSRRLNELGMDYWYDAEHMIDGEGIKEQISHEISSRDRVIIVISQNALDSGWVNFEIKKALDEEKQRKQHSPKGWRILFPIMIDDAFIESDDPDIILLRKDRVASDFRKVDNHREFENSFKKMVLGLRNEVAFY